MNPESRRAAGGAGGAVAAGDRPLDTVAVGGGIAVVAKVVGRGIQFLFHLLLSTHLGVAAYGLYQLGHSALLVVQALALMGTHNGVVRFGATHRQAEDWRRLRGTVYTALAFSLGTSLVCATLLAVFAPLLAVAVFDEPRLTRVLRWFAVALPITVAMRVAAGGLRSFKDMKAAVGLPMTLRPAFHVVLTAALFWLGYELAGALAGFVVATAITALVAVRRLFSLLPASPTKPLFEPRPLLGYSTSVFFVGLSVLLLTRTDRLMLGILSDVDVVGTYNAAAVTASNISLFLLSFNAILAPTFAEVGPADRRERLASSLKAGTRWVVLLTLPLFLGATLFADDLMALFGAEFVVAAPILLILAAAQLVNAGTGGVGVLLSMTGHHKLELGNSVSMAVLNIGLNWFLIQRWGGVGAAIATALSIAVVNLARVVEVSAILRMHPFSRGLVKPAIAALSAVVATTVFGRWLQSVGGHWLVAVTVLVGVYFGTLRALGLAPEDEEMLSRIRRRLARSLPRRRP